MAHSTTPGAAARTAPSTADDAVEPPAGGGGSTRAAKPAKPSGVSRAEKKALKKAANGGTLRTRLKRDRTLILMTLPAVLLVLVFNYIPILGNVVAFQEYDPYISDNGFVAIFHSPWVGFDQFSRIFEDSKFWEAVQNTFVLFSLQLLLFFPIPIVLALLINSVIRPRVRAVSQAILYLPHFFSWVLVITVFQQIFGGAGIIAQTLRQHGYEGFDLMTDPGIFKFLVTAEGVWKDAGWGIIVFLAALASVSPDLYEASAMDGAGRWRRMWHVTLPALRPVIALLLVLRVGDALTVGFEQILLQRDAVGPGAAEVLDTFVWWNGVRNQDFSYAAAAGLIKGVVSLGLVLAANKVAHLMGEQGVYKK
ncbi:MULTISPECIES: ABC transporter permease [Streptomyces]|uniref:ABC transporter permease n=1 Tax=Streptomyces TaxID=1883 RepID=UPI0016723E81|nr:ABC transporter permease subunit [Streptomyces umbrinus]MCR3729245.1 putative aldouronate transport system permease protein [Streptomyces umbrinus]MCX4561262.1 ABC transporter permease subunit [Streptomyces phaeochromogenes]GHB86646.1 polysaccharide ABC transporter ATP-binding protein [Streptomyces umbrinus]GHH66773.1 polysaccharide ABC transporter ATP-binding protein [Streptomyces umbrinus]